MRSNVMKKAWSIARAAVLAHGGSVKEYFALSLKQAWAEIKSTKENSMVEEKKQEKVYVVEKCPLGIPMTLLVKPATITEHGEIWHSWKVPGHAEPVHSDGWYADGKLDGENFVFSNRYMDNFPKAITGFSLPSEIAAEIAQDDARVLEAWKKRHQEIIDDIVAGRLLIELSIVNDSQYVPWVHVEGHNAQKLMNGAIASIYAANGLSTHVSGAIATLQLGLRDGWKMRGVLKIDELPSFASNATLTEAGDNSGYRPGFVKTFCAPISDLMVAALEQRRFEMDQNAKREQREKASYDDELMVFGGVILSSTNFKALHSMGLRKNDEKLRIFTANDARVIPNATTTYDMREVLKTAGWKFDGEEKDWTNADTEGNRAWALDFLRKHDTKAKPEELGMARCWECGRWVKRSRLDSDGYCGC